MSDIYCVVCSEPWDAYGVRNGDMQPWESDLFRSGAGCPCCEGVAPEGVDPDEIAYDAARHEIFCSGDDSGEVCDNFVAIADGTSKRPEWRRPVDPVLWECESCNARVMRDLDTGDLEWHGINVPYCSYDRTLWDDSCQESAPDELTIDGRSYCPHCVVACDGCGEPTFSEETFLDQRTNYMNPEVLCEDCYHAIPICCYCGEQLGDDEETYDGHCESCAKSEGLIADCAWCNERLTPADLDSNSECATCATDDH